MIREKRGRAAAHVVVAPIDTAQPCNPRSSSEISFDVHVCIVEENTEGEIDPEPDKLEKPSAGTSQLESLSAGTSQLESSSAGTDQLESPSAGISFETPGQQCLPIWEMGRTTVDGCLLVGISSNLRGNIFLSKSSLPVCLKTRIQPTKKTRNSTLGGRRGATALKSGCTGIYFFSGGTLGLDARLVSFVFACLSVVFCSYQEIIFLRAEENMRGKKKTNEDANQVDGEHNRRASIFLPITPLKINTSRFDTIATRWEYVSLVVSLC